MRAEWEVCRAGNGSIRLLAATKAATQQLPDGGRSYGGKRAVRADEPDPEQLAHGPLSALGCCSWAPVLGCFRPSGQASRIRSSLLMGPPCLGVLCRTSATRMRSGYATEAPSTKSCTARQLTGTSLAAGDRVARGRDVQQYRSGGGTCSSTGASHDRLLPCSAQLCS